MNSRPHKAQPRVWRRRECPKCHTLVSTYEQIDTADQQRIGAQPYSVARMTISLYGFLPVSTHAADDAAALAQTVGESLTSRAGTPTSKAELAALTHHILTRFDKKAGLKYGVEHDCIDPSSVR